MKWQKVDPEALGRPYVGAPIKCASIERRDPETLVIEFEDLPSIEIADHGQSCCERRYMRTDDDLSSLTGERFVSIELREVAEKQKNEEFQECVFLVIQTDRQAVTIANMNEHNGYYGGFAMQARVPKEGT